MLVPTPHTVGCTNNNNNKKLPGLYQYQMISESEINYLLFGQYWNSGYRWKVNIGHPYQESINHHQMLIFQLYKNDTSLFPFFLCFGDCWWTGALQPDTLLQCPGKKKQIAAQNLLKPQGYEWSCRIMKQHSESVCVFTLLLLFDFHSQHPAALGERTLNNLQYPPIINQIKKPTSIGQKFTCKVKKKSWFSVIFLDFIFCLSHQTLLVSTLEGAVTLFPSMEEWEREQQWRTTRSHLTDSYM